MTPLLRIYRVLFVADFQQAAQYRVQSVLWLLFAVIRPIVFLAAWSAAANAQGGSIGDFSVGVVIWRMGLRQFSAVGA